MRPLCSRGTTSPFTDHDLISDLIGLPADRVKETLGNYDLRTLGTLTENELEAAGLTPARARRLHRLDASRRVPLLFQCLTGIPRTGVVIGKVASLPSVRSSMLPESLGQR